MPNTYTCFLHRTGVLTPELRVVTCEPTDDLPERILAEARSWPAFDVLDVYDEDDRQIYRFSFNESATH
jgi:hypothetical protein